MTATQKLMDSVADLGDSETNLKSPSQEAETNLLDPQEAQNWPQQVPLDQVHRGEGQETRIWWRLFEMELDPEILCPDPIPHAQGRSVSTQVWKVHKFRAGHQHS